MTIIGIYEVKGDSDVHLVEMLADEPPGNFDMGLLTQEIPGIDALDWQSPWDEKYLNATGEKIIGDYTDVPANESNTRVVFFFHYIDFNRSFKTQFGEIELTKPTVMPDRLQRILKYEKPD